MAISADAAIAPGIHLRQAFSARLIRPALAAVNPFATRPLRQSLSSFVVSA
jgi:hypothetical protein